MLRRARNPVVLVATVVIFFALVSPYMPTPTAVTTAKKMPLPAIVVMALAALLAASPLAVVAFVAEAAAPVRVDRLLALTCVRLC